LLKLFNYYKYFKDKIISTNVKIELYSNKLKKFSQEKFINEIKSL